MLLVVSGIAAQRERGRFALSNGGGGGVFKIESLYNNNSYLWLKGEGGHVLEPPSRSKTIIIYMGRKKAKEEDGERRKGRGPHHTRFKNAGSGAQLITKRERDTHHMNNPRTFAEVQRGMVQTRVYKGKVAKKRRRENGKMWFDGWKLLAMAMAPRTTPTSTTITITISSRSSHLQAVDRQGWRHRHPFTSRYSRLLEESVVDSKQFPAKILTYCCALFLLPLLSYNILSTDL